jgi:hypothetical protein
MTIAVSRADDLADEATLQAVLSSQKAILHLKEHAPLYSYISFSQVCGKVFTAHMGT